MKKLVLIIILSLCFVFFVSCESEEAVSSPPADEAESQALSEQESGTSEQASETVDDGSVIIDAALVDKLELFMPYEDALKILGTEGKRIPGGMTRYEYILTDGRTLRIALTTSPKSRIRRIGEMSISSPSDKSDWSYYESTDFDEFVARILAEQEDAIGDSKSTIVVPRLVSDKYRFVKAAESNVAYYYYYVPVDQENDDFQWFVGIYIYISKEDGSFDIELKRAEETEKDGAAYVYPVHMMILNNNGKCILINMPADVEPADTVEKMNEYFIFEPLEAFDSK